MGVWCDSLRNQQSEKTGAVSVCRKEGWRALLHNVDAIVLPRFDFVLDSGRPMGVSSWPRAAVPNVRAKQMDKLRISAKGCIAAPAPKGSRRPQADRRCPPAIRFKAAVPRHHNEDALARTPRGATHRGSQNGRVASVAATDHLVWY